MLASSYSSRNLALCPPPALAPPHTYPNQVENEVRILSSLTHANIITYHCSFQVQHSC